MDYGAHESFSGSIAHLNAVHQSLSSVVVILSEYQRSDQQGGRQMQNG